MDIAQAMADFSGLVWGTPLAILLTGAGVLFTIMTAGIQLKALTHGVAVVTGKYDNPEDAGNISHFQALCAALSGTVGLGNIAGVAVAVSTGGAGAVFWMWVVGLLGMATKFTECTLAMIFRQEDATGTYRGGPMYSIEKGLGHNTTDGMRHFAKFLAISFAVLGMCACVGAGNMFQANQVARIFVNLLKSMAPSLVQTQNDVWNYQMLVGAVVMVFAALVIIGGIKRLGNVASTLVPSMCLIYVLGAITVILIHVDEVPGMFASIFRNAFTDEAGRGAFFGVGAKTAILLGVKRACFSNEAGLGSSPMAHSTAKTNEPIREGLVAAMEPFIDTVVVCTMTALVILITDAHARPAVAEVTGVSERRLVDKAGAKVHEFDLFLRFNEGSEAVCKPGESFFVHNPPAIEGAVAGKEAFQLSSTTGLEAKATVQYGDDDAGRTKFERAVELAAVGKEVYLYRDGINLSAYSFDLRIPLFGTYFIPLAAFLFAFSTIVTWGFYGETCAEYLFGVKALMPFRVVYVGAILVGTSSTQLGPVLDWSDAMLGLMMIPNMIGCLLLSPKMARATRDYFNRLKAGDFEDEVRRAREAKARIKAARSQGR